MYFVDSFPCSLGSDPEEHGYAREYDRQGTDDDRDGVLDHVPVPS
jgi:hypothetical protein